MNEVGKRLIEIRGLTKTFVHEGKRIEVLRRKLGRHGRIIQTVSKVGYCLRAA